MRDALCVVCKVWVQIWQSLKEPCSKVLACGEVATNGRRSLEEAGLVDTAGIKSGLPNLVNIFLLVALC